ncbi:hypothetical protein OL548_34475 (plasmid) [Lysinibacillus sp. MHQ-1]|nr:hypothetical protein OL548_34475 [Lysinibacillus sp. MHQ-1]
MKSRNQKIQDGDQQIQSKVSEENAKAAEEDRLNAMNQQAQQQQALIGGESE